MKKKNAVEGPVVVSRETRAKAGKKKQKNRVIEGREITQFNRKGGEMKQRKPHAGGNPCRGVLRTREKRKKTCPGRENTG